jgi:hypothetical protein
MLRRNKIFLTVALVAIVLIAVRAALPYVVKDYVNDTLHRLQAYDGSVDDIDLALWRGAYRIDGLRIDKRGKQEPTPFFSSDRIDFSVEWRSLVQGSLVSEVVFIRPNLNLVQEKSPQESQLGKEENWQAQLEELFPFRFNTIELRDGTVTFRAPGIRTEDALKAERVSGTLSNLTNVVAANKETFAAFGLKGTVLGNAPARVDGSLDPWAPQPTFDVNVEVKHVSLPNVNPWLRQYIKADAESGDFELFLEIAAAEGRFKGYAKPVLRNVNITSAEEEDNPLRKLWEGIVEFAANVFENDKEEQVAARIPFTGTIEDPKASIWATIGSVVRNAFVSAFARSLEGSISLRDVKKNLGKYAEKDDGKAKQQEDTDEKKREAPKNFGPRSTG